MQSAEVKKTGGQVDELCLALVDAANDGHPDVKEVIVRSLHEIGKRQPEMVLTSIKGYLIKHQKLNVSHRVVLLQAAAKVVRDSQDSLSLELAKQMVKLASAELTRTKDVEPDWQGAASEVLVAIGIKFDHEVMADLLEKLVPGTLPHYFVVQTLASFSTANAFGVVPFLKDIIGRMLPMMGIAKQENMRWVFANCLGRFSESIIYYVANAENAPYPDITTDRFFGEIYSSYDVLFNVWLNSKEPKVRLAVVDAIGHMTHIMSREKLEEHLPKLLPGVTGLYKKHAEHYLITQGLCSVLEAACTDGSIILSPHLDHLLGGIHTMACNMPDFSNPVTVKNHNELLRCFSVLAKTFTDRLVAFLLNKLESNNEKVRVGTLAIIRHLINSSGSYLENKEELLITGVQIVLNDNNLKVRRMLVQAVTAMAYHGYLELPGGQKLMEFIVSQCAIQDVDEEKPRKPTESDAVTPRALRAMCENILHLLTTTVSIMEPVLWPFLLECVVPEPFTKAMGPLCRSLGHLAAKKREEEGADFNIDFDVQTNVPRPTALIARFMVIAGHPWEGAERGVHVLKLMKSLSPVLHPNLVEIWDTVIPKLVKYLEDNADEKEKWNQKSWEDLVLKLLSKSLDEVEADDWVCSLGQEMGNQFQLYTNYPHEKNFLFKCMGVVMRKATNNDFVQGQLNVMFSKVKHSSQIEREGCAIGVGFCAGSHLDTVLMKLEQVAKNQMSRKSSGLLGFMKDKNDPEVERIKSTVMLCYGYAIFYAPPSLITSRLEANVFRVILGHFKNVKDVHVKQNIIRTVELIGKSLEPTRLQQPDFNFTRRGELLENMLKYVKAEPSSTITNEIRPLAINACASLAKLNPRMTDEEVADVIKTNLGCVYTIQPAVGKTISTAKNKQESEEDKDSATLIIQSLQNLNQLLKEILLRDPIPVMLHDILKHVEEPWLLSTENHERERAIETTLFVLNAFHDNMLVTVGGQPMVFESLGSLLAHLVPRCTDPLVRVRQSAIECIQKVLRISLRYEGFAADSKDELVDALSTLKQRASEDDANVLFSVASDLSKVLAKKIPSEQLPLFVSTLQEGLTDSQHHSSSGACVVLNSTLRIRGHELKKEVNKILLSIHDKLPEISHAQTRTGTLRSMRTLCSHHLIPFITNMLEFPLPYDKHVTEIWQILASDSNLALSIFDYLLDLITRSLPYQEKPNPKRKKETIRVATAPPTAITCALTEMFRAEETGELVLENFHRLFPAILLRIGTCVGLHPPDPPQTSKKDKEKPVVINPLSSAVECMKELLVRCQYDKLRMSIEADDGWKQFEDEKTYTDGITVVARALCTSAPQHVHKVVNHLNPSMSSAYDSQRIVVAALFAELINQRCGGNLDLVEVLMNSLLGRLVDSSHLVRKYCIQGLGNISTAGDAQIEKYSTTILSAMMAGMDDKDDIEDEITLESMSGLAKILAKLDENNVRQILINICLRIRPCFEKDKAAVRAAAFTVFGKLSRFGGGPSKIPFLEQIHTNFISVLLHMNEEPEVTKACKGALRMVGPLLVSSAINDMFQKHLLEEGHLHYGEFMNDLSRLIIADFPDKMGFYVMGCVSFFKSSRDDIKANAAMFVGFLLGNLPVDKRDEISKDHVCGALILLLKDPSAKVRSKAAEAMSLLYDY